MSDKRTVATDALETLGMLISENEKRDAIHLAVEPTVALTELTPGQHVSVNGDLQPPYVGIVDPFLKVNVRKGDRFWLIVYPRQINSLRHVWTHPAFPEIKFERSISKEAAEDKLLSITESWDGPSYDQFIELVNTGRAGDSYGDCYEIEGDYIYSYGRDASGEIPSEAWDLAEVIVGRKIESRPSYFSCSC